MFTRLQGQTWVGFTVMDKHTLGPKIRQGIRDGLLPTQRPSRTWFGFAQGDTSCAACGQPVAIRELECEAEFPGEPQTYLFHAACFEAWQTERDRARVRRVWTPERWSAWRYRERRSCTRHVRSRVKRRRCRGRCPDFECERPAGASG